MICHTFLSISYVFKNFETGKCLANLAYINNGNVQVRVGSLDGHLIIIKQKKVLIKFSAEQK